jgi:hypothetical protein
MYYTINSKCKMYIAWIKCKLHVSCKLNVQECKMFDENVC